MNYVKLIFSFLLDIIKSRQLIWSLVKKDIKTRYLGSYLGILWAFIQPTISILIFWFVFEIGFKSAPVDKVPFILWLISGMIPWFFISDGLSSATASILENNFLVKKVVFRVSILPLIKVFSSLLIHLFFVILMISLFLFYGYVPTLFYLQLAYYLFAAVILLLGLSWITSALIVFLRDMGQIVAMVLQFGFWMTPIFWSLKMVPEQYHFLLVLNPVYYIVEGYRNSLVYGKWFWADMSLTIYFWGITIAIFFAGALIFRRLRPHFADVL